MIAVVGKGGVGKTTVTAALACQLASQGRSVLVADVEGKSELARLFGADSLSSRPTVLRAETEESSAISGCTVAPEKALFDYLVEHNLGPLAKRLGSSGVIDVVATSTPGVKDLLVLGRIKSYVHGSIADVVIVDTPASGHAVSFLQGPRALARTVQSGTIHRQADEVRELLAGPDAGVIMVSLPEELPVRETIETAATLETSVGTNILGVVVNGVVPTVPQARDLDQANGFEPGEREALEAALSFERSRVIRQNEQMRMLANGLPVKQITLPRLATPDVGENEIRELALIIGDQMMRGQP